MPAPTRSHRVGRAHSIYASRHTHSATWETRRAGTSIGNRCAADTAPHRTPRTDPRFEAWCCVGHCAGVILSRLFSVDTAGIFRSLHSRTISDGEKIVNRL